jgi:ShK domain-like
LIPNKDSGEADLRLGADLGEPQALEDLEHYVLEIDTAKRIRKSREYMKDLEMDQALLDLCINKHRSCTVWAVAGECTKNPGYMKINVRKWDDFQFTWGCDGVLLINDVRRRATYR